MCILIDKVPYLYFFYATYIFTIHFSFVRTLPYAFQ